MRHSCDSGPGARGPGSWQPVRPGARPAGNRARSSANGARRLSRPSPGRPGPYPECREHPAGAQQLLWQLPPAVRGVLQNDPSLIERPDYLAPYPALAGVSQAASGDRAEPGVLLRDGPRTTARPEPAEAVCRHPGRNRAVPRVHDAPRHRRLRGAPGRGLPPLGATNADADRRPHEDPRSHAVERGPVGLRADAGWTKLSRVRACRPRAGTTGMASAPFGRILWSVQAGVVLAALGIGLRLRAGHRPRGNRSGLYRARHHRDVTGSGRCDLGSRCLRPVVPARLAAEPETRNQCVK